MNMSITLDTYSHAIPAMQEEAAALIAGLVLAGNDVDQCESVRDPHGVEAEALRPPAASRSRSHSTRRR
jgi:hypothetical protein